ncbi:MAG: hypothetical protein RIS92_2245 [Verrucomicrobiota bacterium]
MRSGFVPAFFGWNAGAIEGFGSGSTRGGGCLQDGE